MLSKAIALAAKEFEGIYDKGGAPYILHCLHVMNKVKYQGDEDLMIIAVLHDLVEDTKYEIPDLFELGFSHRVLDALILLTHSKYDTYDYYIGGIYTNIDAVRVKLQDLRHNSDIMRIKGIRDKDIQRIEKYHKAYLKLKMHPGLVG